METRSDTHCIPTHGGEEVDKQKIVAESFENSIRSQTGHLIQESTAINVIV